MYMLQKVSAHPTFSCWKRISELSEVQRNVFDNLLNHHLNKDNSLVLIRSCDKQVYKVENQGVLWNTDYVPGCNKFPKSYF